MTGIALGAGWDVVARLSGRQRAVMTAAAPRGRALELSAGVARFARGGPVCAGQRVACREMIEAPRLGRLCERGGRQRKHQQDGRYSETSHNRTQ